MIGEPSSRSSSPSVAGQERPAPVLAEAVDEVAGLGRRVDHRHERAALGLDEQVGTEQRGAGGVGPRGRPVRVLVVHLDAQPGQRPVRGRRHRDPRGQRPATSYDGPGGCAVRSGDLLDVLGGTHAGGRLGRPGQREAEHQLLLDGLVPGQLGAAVDVQPLAGLAVGVVDLAVLELQEAEVDDDGGRVADVAQHGVHRHARRLAEPAVGGTGRPEDAELPAVAVLVRAGAVGVEQVALVEHRVGDGAGGLQPLGGHAHGATAPSAGVASSASASSRPIVSSHEIRPCRAR